MSGQPASLTAGDRNANMTGDQKAPELWETFCDRAYFDWWCVRRVGERRWGYCFHLPSYAEAEGLLDLLNTNGVR